MADQVVKVSFQNRERTLVVLRRDTPRERVRIFAALLIVDLLNRKHRTNLSPPSNPLADTALTVGETWRDLAHSFITCDGIAYRAPGVKLGQEIVSTIAFRAQGQAIISQSVVFSVPTQCQDLVNAAIVARGVTSRDILGDRGKTLFDFALESIHSLDSMDINALTDAVNRIVDSVGEFRFNTASLRSRLVVVPEYSGTTNTWQEVHEETGVPHGAEVKHTLTSRRIAGDKVDYAGLLVRHVSNFLDVRQTVNAGFRPSDFHGVVAEVQEVDLAKIEALLA